MQQHQELGTIFYPHFTNKETEAEVTLLAEVKLEFEPRLLTTLCVASYVTCLVKWPEG